MSDKFLAHTGEPLRIAVVGTGYVGLVTGACLAALGHTVTCLDTSLERVASVNCGAVPFHEPGLPELLQRCIRAGRLRASSRTSEVVSESDITFIAVGTPSSDLGIDLSYLTAATEEIGTGLRNTRNYHVVVVKSTVVPGTTDTLVRAVIERASGLQAGSFGLCMNPEFLREGCAITDFMESDRLIIGQWDERSGARLAEVYSAFRCPKLFTTLRNAELTKYASNALLATLISFSNELAAICEATPHADVDQVLRGLHLDRRFGSTKSNPAEILSYLRAGCGFGGSCLPKDILAIRQYAVGKQVQTPLLDAVTKVNWSRPSQLVSLAEEAAGPLGGRTVAVLGLAFKPGTDDLRDSPALSIIRTLQGKNARVRAYDPLISKVPDANDLTVCDSAEAALTGADLVILATAWPEFAQYDWRRLCSLMRSAIVVDGRNVLLNTKLPESAVYAPIGRHFKSRGETIVK